MRMELTDKQLGYFWRKVDVRGDDECWEWTGCKNKQGYGNFYINRKLLRPHRFSWIIHFGDIPQGEGYHGICVCHKCDNPGCVNPRHLWLGTNMDNQVDSIKKGRHGHGHGKNYKKPNLSGEKNHQHKLTETEVLEIRDIYSTGLYYQKTLALKYNVWQSTIWAIVNRKRWAHI